VVEGRISEILEKIEIRREVIKYVRDIVSNITSGNCNLPCFIKRLREKMSWLMIIIISLTPIFTLLSIIRLGRK
jgi:hypothetical protein